MTVSYQLLLPRLLIAPTAMNYDQSYKSLNILLVDDDDDDRQSLYEAIRSHTVDLTIHAIANGEQLMTYLSHCSDDIPDLIFLDLNMPRKTGMECLIEIRANANLNNTVVAIYSTSSNKKEIDSAFLAGANIFITKPNSDEALKKIVDDVLSINWQYRTTPMRKEHFMMVR